MVDVVGAPPADCVDVIHVALEVLTENNAHLPEPLIGAPYLHQRRPPEGRQRPRAFIQPPLALCTATFSVQEGCQLDSFTHRLGPPPGFGLAGPVGRPLGRVALVRDSSLCHEQRTLVGFRICDI